MDYRNKKIVLEDNREYIVLEQVDYDNHTYLYIVSKENIEDTAFVEIRNDNILKIDPKIFNERIFALFIDKLKK